MLSTFVHDLKENLTLFKNWYDDEKPENMDGVERKVERSKEQFFRIVRPLEHLLQSAILYVASRELARGAVLNVKSQEKM